MSTILFLVLASQPGTATPQSSPFEAPAENDRTFVTTDDPMLDTPCLYRRDGPIEFDIMVSRYVGETDADGYLVDAESLITNGVVAPKATLQIPALDVDFDVPVGIPERDHVYFNDEPVGYLQGENDKWELSSFEIDISKVKFAGRYPGQPGQPGLLIGPVANRIRIEIDVYRQHWCTAVDWGALSIKAMSPVVLVHGNNSNARFFDRMYFTQAFQRQSLAYDNSIQLETSPRAANSDRLRGILPLVVASFGVDSIHLVAHSKGGLDLRDYLVRHQPELNGDFRVLSLTTLSTPHNGSVLADVALERMHASKESSEVEFVGFPSFAALLAQAGEIDAGTQDVSTSSASQFNTVNLSALPYEIAMHTIGGDADRNGNEKIDRQAPDEYLGLRLESPNLQTLDATPFHAGSRIAVNVMYKTLLRTRTIEVIFHTIFVDVGQGYSTKTIATIVSLPSPIGIGNDVLVTIPSARGVGGFDALTSRTQAFSDGQAMNHSTIASDWVADHVIPWLVSVENQSGDLR